MTDSNQGPSTPPDTTDDPGDRWPMESYDAARTGYNAASNVPQEGVTAKWTATVAPEARVTRPPIIDRGRIYVGFRNENRTPLVTALDARTGESTWTTELPTDGRLVAGPAVTPKTVYVGVVPHRQGESNLFALSSREGSVRWRASIPGPLIASPVFDDGILLATMRPDGAVYAYARDGTREWRAPIGDEPSTAVCVADGRVFVGTGNGKVVALDRDGSPCWTERIVTGRVVLEDEVRARGVSQPPVVANGTLYVAGSDKKLYAASTADGTTEWSATLVAEDYGTSPSLPAVTEDTIYTNTIHGGLVAFDATDGTERWRIDENGYGSSGQPAVTDSVVVAPMMGTYVVGYDTSGRQLWTVEVEKREAPGFVSVDSSPRVAVARDCVYYTQPHGRVQALGSP